MRESPWTAEHVDFLDQLARQSLTTQEMSAQMSKQFKMRITPSQVSALLSRMRKHGDEFFRNTPYRAARVRSY